MEPEQDGLPAVHAEFPLIPQPTANQPHEVAPCYTIYLPPDMEPEGAGSAH